MIDIDHLIKNSRKQRDSKSLMYYQNVKTEFVKAEKEHGNSLSEDSQIKILAKYIKKLEDAEKQYSQAAREDLASECRDELEVLRKLLPEPVKESEICDFVLSYALDRNWAGTDDVSTRVMIPKKSMGEVIKATKAQFPTADGKMISEIVKANLE